MSASNQQAIDRAARSILSATHLCFLAGAGMGVDGGLPCFRGKEGFWNAYPPMKRLGLEFHQMSTPKWFENDPALAHGFFGHRYELYSSKKPHEGYHILKELSTMPNIKDYFVFTSNVDGHFLQLFPEDKVLECHGSIHYLQCSKQCCDAIYSVEEHNQKCPEEQKYPIHVNMDTFKVEEKSIPKCLHCGEVARPNILMFGDWGWLEQRYEKQEDAYRKFRKQTKNAEDAKVVMIEIGAGKGVPTVRHESENLLSRAFKSKTHQAETTLIRINMEDEDVPEEFVEACGQNSCVSLKMGGLAALKEIKQRMLQLQKSQ